MLRGSYAYPQCFANEDEFVSFINSEFGERLAGSVYLDHAGAALAAQSQLDEVFQQCRTLALANPHSHSIAGSGTATLIERVRAHVLAHFNVDLRSHDLIFTSGATAALQLVAEMFPWHAGGTFCYLNDNHTSVVGIRDVAIKNGAGAVHVVDAQLQTMAEIHRNSNASLEAPCLFAYPAESNFSGTRYDLDLIQRVQSGALDSHASPRDRWYVLLDAAKFAATAPLDLSAHRADFVPISFYKLFGYPTGLGALIVRRDTVSRLISDQSAMYFGGGTVEVVDSLSSFHVNRKGFPFHTFVICGIFLQLTFVMDSGFSQRFERGTPNYFAIAALPAGFRILDRLSMSAISAHCAALTKYTVSQMQELQHSNGRPLCQIYGAHLPESQEQNNFVGQGPVITCSLLRAGGAVIGFGEVESLASHACTPPLQFRTGCFCNAGACQSHLDISSDLLRRQHASGRVCGDAHDVIDGRPTGAIRISFGYSSTLADADAWLHFLRTMFLQPADSIAPMPSEPTSVLSTVELSAIYVYPVKSCGAIRASQWSIGDRGLLYDREWAIVGTPTSSVVFNEVYSNICPWFRFSRSCAESETIPSHVFHHSVD
jgi:molybdenum cofactor sulfurtransferase